MRTLRSSKGLILAAVTGGLLFTATGANVLRAAPPIPRPGPPGTGGRTGGGALAPGGTSRPKEADVVLRNGAIYTVDAVRSWAESVVIRKDTIVYVGPDAGVAPYIGSRTRVIDLRGRMVLPGFQDAHIHPVAGGIGQMQCTLNEGKTRDDYLKIIGKYAADHPERPWVRGDGWGLSAFAPTGIPDRSFLDTIVPDKPVYLESSDGHSAWVNSKALQIAGLTKDTPDPPGGRIDRDPKTGEPVGSLQDSAMELVKRKSPPYTAQERADGLRRALKMLNGYGITSFQDADVSLDDTSDMGSLETYRDLDAKGELTARVVESLWWERSQGEEQVARLLETRRKYTRGLVRATTVKIMQDGVMEVQTAAMLQPYKGKGEMKGIEMVPPEDLKKYVTRLDKEGFQVHFHAIGDAAIRHCLDAVEAARRANGPRDARHHISHLEAFHPSDIPRFRALGVVANFQPLWAFADDYMVKLTLPFLEPERARWLYPIGSLYRSGAVLAFGSDWSVSSANPLEELEVAVTRMGPDGETKEPFLPDERISLPEALAAFTIGSAYVNFQEDRTGSIEVGKFADLIVLDRNLFTIRPEAISDTKVLLTLFGGQPVSGDWSQAGATQD